MKKLNTYLEGLLNKSDKTSASSTHDALCSDYIYSCLKGRMSTIKWEVLNKVVKFIYSGSASGWIDIELIDSIVSKFNIKNVMFDGNWLLYLNEDAYDIPVDIECNSRIHMCRNFNSRKPIIVKNINIKAEYIVIDNKIELSNSQARSKMVEIENQKSIINCKIQAEYIVLSLTSLKSVKNSVNNTKVPNMEDLNVFNRVDWFTEDPERVREIKNINPSVVLGFNKHNVDNILVEKNRYNGMASSYDVLTFTKNPKSFTPEYPDIYEMKNGWHAMWLDHLWLINLKHAIS